MTKYKVLRRSDKYILRVKTHLDISAVNDWLGERNIKCNKILLNYAVPEYLVNKKNYNPLYPHVPVTDMHFENVDDITFFIMSYL